MKICACSKCGRGDVVKLLHSEHNQYRLRCDNCGYCSKTMNSKLDAVEMWNMEHRQ